MCGCKKHGDKSAECTCICPEHRNFDRAYDLAQQRYDEIRALRSELAAQGDIFAADGVYVVHDGTITPANVQHAAVDLAERLGSIDRAALVAQLRAIADVVERHAPCDGRVAAS